MTLKPLIKIRRSIFLIFSVLIFGGPLRAAFLTPVDDNVNDFANVITNDRKNQIKTILDRVERQTGVELTLVTVPTLSEYKISTSKFDSFAQTLFNEWGIGHKNINNGILILVSVKEHLIRFEFGSDYTEQDLAKLRSTVTDKILPYFRKKDYSNALFASAMYAIQEVTVPISFWEYYHSAIFMWSLGLISLGFCLVGYSKQKKGLAFASFVFMGIFLFILVNDLRRDSRLAGFGGGATSGVGITRNWMES